MIMFLEVADCEGGWSYGQEDGRASTIAQNKRCVRHLRRAGTF